MKRNIWIIYAFLCLLAVGCIDDKTIIPTSYIAMPDSVMITNNTTGEQTVLTSESSFTFSVQPGEELSLSAQIFDAEARDFRCEWQINIVDYEANTIDLEIASESETFAQTIYEATNGALLVYPEGRDGAFTFPFSITIAAPYSTGIMIVGKQGGQGVLDFIEVSTSTEDLNFNGSPLTDFTLVNHILHEGVYPLCNNGEEFPCDNVLSVTKMANSGFQGSSFVMLSYYQILDADYTKAVTVSNTSLEKITMLSDEFIEVPDNLQPKSFIETPPVSLLLDESGKVYTRVNYDAGLPCTGRFTSDPLAYDDPNDYPDKGSEVVQATQIYPGGFIYEAAKKRLLKVESTDGETISFASFTSWSTPPANYIPLDNFDVDEIIGVYQLGGSSSTNFCVIYRKNGELYIQNFTYMNMYGFVSYSPKNSLQVTGDVKQLWDTDVVRITPSITSMFPALTGYFYFASGNALYRSSLSGSNLEKLIECDGEITDFALTSYSTKDLTGAEAAEKYYNGNVFTVAIDNADVQVIKVYEDPQQPGKKLQEILLEKHYDGGVAALQYCDEMPC